MRRPRRPTDLARAAAALAAALALLGGCAEVHHGVEAVGRIGGTPAPVAEAAPVRVDVRTVRPRGAARRPAVDPGAADEAPPAALASAVPTPRQIFDFHPAGSNRDGWRQPFVIDPSDGPLAADVRRSAAELRTFLADQKAGRDKAGPVGTARRRCGESDVATGKPGCGSTLPRAAAASAAPDRPAP